MPKRPQTCDNKPRQLPPMFGTGCFWDSTVGHSRGRPEHIAWLAHQLGCTRYDVGADVCSRCVGFDLELEPLEP